MKSIILCCFFLFLTICVLSGRSNPSKQNRFLQTLESQDFNVKKPLSNERSNRKKRSAKGKCSFHISPCRCRSKRTIVCDKDNCLQRLPTESMTEQEGRRINNIIISRQKDFTKISSTDLSILPNLRSIRFYGNKIYLISANAFKWTQMLDRLDMHKNELVYVPSALKYLPNLRLLNLGGNKIRSISTRAFSNNQKLKQLVLRANKLERFPRNLPRSLVKLTLSDNRLSTLEDLRYLTNLKILRLDMNRFMVLNSNAFPNSLRELNLCNNLMSSDRSLSFDNLRALKRLRLSGNAGIKRIHMHTFFRGPQKLEILDLRQCSIEYIEGGAFSCLPKLKVIALAENKLTAYNPEWFAHSRQLRTLALSNNPWRCTCDFAKQLEELQNVFEKKISEKDKNKMTSETNRKYSFQDDFANITCQELDPELQAIIGKHSRQRVSLSTIRTSSCKTTSNVWELKQQICFINKQDTAPRTIPATKIPTTNRRISEKLSIFPTTTTTTTATSTLRLTTTTQTTTLQPTTTTQTTALQPTTTTRKTTLHSTSTTTKTTTTTTSKPSTTTKTTTSKPSTTTKTTTTIRPTTTTTTSTSTLSSQEETYERACTEGGADCVFPFTYQGDTYTKCVPSSSWFSSSSWCFTDAAASNYDYCTECTK